MSIAAGSRERGEGRHRYDFSLSVVIPVYDDEEVLEELHTRLSRVLDEVCHQSEIVFVDDGSRDNSMSVLRGAREKDSRIRIVQLAKNFGQLNAIAAGLDHAEGDVVVIMDSDLQDRPEDIPKLLDRMVETDAPMVIVRWVRRKDSMLKVAASRLFQYVTNRITNLRTTPGLGIFRAVRRVVVETIRQFPERSATGISLMYWIGFRYEIIDLERDARFAGSSGYTLRKMLALAFDRVFSYSLFPIRMASVLGLIASFLSILFALFFVLQRLLLDNLLPGWTSLIAVILFLFGINFIFLGVVGEYLGRIFLESKQRPRYVIGQLLERTAPWCE